MFGYEYSSVRNGKGNGMTKNILFVYCTLLILIGSDCKNNPITPPDDTPGRRDYTWFVDTIYAGGNIIRGIDGVSPNDVWAISEAGDFSQTFYHFDGTKWSTDSAYQSMAPEAVRAFASNDVWSVGLSGDIWHYNGTSWSQNAKIPPPNTNYYTLEDVDGIISSDLFTVGNYSISGSDLHPLIYHLSGNSLSRINIQDVPFCTIFKIRFYAPGKSLVIGLKHLPDGSSPDSSKIFSFDGSNLYEIYSAQDNQDGLSDIARIVDGIIISKGRRLVFFNGNQEQDITTVQSTSFGNVIEARSTKDIFLGMSDGIAHYNGGDIQYLFKFDITPFGGIGIKLFANSAFIVTYYRDQNMNVVYRGYLK